MTEILDPMDSLYIRKRSDHEADGIPGLSECYLDNKKDLGGSSVPSEGSISGSESRRTAESMRHISIAINYPRRPIR